MANEKRLIDANALLGEIERIYTEHYEKSAYKFIHDFFRAMIRRVRIAPTVDAVEVCIHEVINYIDRAFDRQLYDSIWFDEKGEMHSADVGYGGEWWDECMKPELLRVFSNVGAKMDGDGNA